MAGPIIFLSVRDVLAIHRNTIESEGGSAGLRDPGLLDAAVSMPRQAFGDAYLHDGLAEMAAAYLFHLANNHPFVDGNKRVALSSMLVFLMANGVEQLPEEDDAAERTLDVASGQMGKAELTAWVRRVTGLS